MYWLALAAAYFGYQTTVGGLDQFSTLRYEAEWLEWAFRYMWYITIGITGLFVFLYVFWTEKRKEVGNGINSLVFYGIPDAFSFYVAGGLLYKIFHENSTFHDLDLTTLIGIGTLLLAGMVFENKSSKAMKNISLT